MTKEAKNICPICGKVVKPRGLGAHLRLAHGVIEKAVLSNSSEHKSEQLSDTSGLSKVKSSDLSDLREIRPSDYLKKRESVIKKKILPVFPAINIVNHGHVQIVESGREAEAREAVRHGHGSFNTIVASLAEWKAGFVLDSAKVLIERQAEINGITVDEYFERCETYLKANPDEKSIWQ
jgi:hypothetical protein